MFNDGKPEVGQIIQGEFGDDIAAIVTDRGNYRTKLRELAQGEWYAVSTKSKCDREGLICFIDKQPKPGEKIRIILSRPKKNFVCAIVCSCQGTKPKPEKGQIIEGAWGDAIVALRTDRDNFHTRLRVEDDEWVAASTEEECEHGLMCFIDKDLQEGDAIEITYSDEEKNFVRGRVFLTEEARQVRHEQGIRRW